MELGSDITHQASRQAEIPSVVERLNARAEGLESSTKELETRLRNVIRMDEEVEKEIHASIVREPHYTQHAQYLDEITEKLARAEARVHSLLGRLEL